MMKRVLAIILALSFLISLAAIPASATEKTEQKVIPHLNIHGFMCCPLYEDKTNEDSAKIWPPDGRIIAEAVFDLVPALFRYLFNRDRVMFTEKLVKSLNKVFKPLCCDSKGNPVIEGSGAYCPLPTKTQIDANPTIEYPYDWRLDPFDSAADLNKYINYICDDLGYGQVVIECHSNAGTIVLTYFAEYGTEKVRSCCFSATAVYGAGFAAELIEGKLLINGGGIEEYLTSLFYNNEKSKILTPIVKIASKIKLLDLVANFINGLMVDAHDRFYGTFAFPVLGNWLNIWAMVPDAYLENGIAYCRDNFKFDMDGEYKEFFEDIDRYKTTVRDHREELLERINEDCNVYVFCMYGLPGLPIAADWNTMSDGILYSTDTSFGATFKNYIDTSRFEAGAFISPDGKCDASTAKFRDQTWYFYECNHLLKNDYLNKMAKDLLFYDGQATVSTFEEYPMFLRFDPATLSISPAK